MEECFPPFLGIQTSYSCRIIHAEYLYTQKSYLEQIGGSFWELLIGMIFLNPLGGAAVGAVAGALIRMRRCQKKT